MYHRLLDIEYKCFKYYIITESNLNRLVPLASTYMYGFWISCFEERKNLKKSRSSISLRAVSVSLGVMSDSSSSTSAGGRLLAADMSLIKTKSIVEQKHASKSRQLALIGLTEMHFLLWNVIIFL